MRNLCCRLLFYQNLLINRLLPSIFVLVSGIVFIRLNGLIIQCLNSMFDELKEVKHFNEIANLMNLTI